MGHNKQISGELHIIFVQSVTHQFLFILQKDALLMYRKFDYFVQRNQPLLLSLGCCLEEKIRQISGA